MEPDYSQDGFVSEQPPSIHTHRFTAQVGPQAIGRFNSRRGAEQAISEVDVRAAWFADTKGDLTLLYTRT